MLRAGLLVGICSLLLGCGDRESPGQDHWVDPVSGVAFVHLPAGHLLMGMAGDMPDSLSATPVKEVAIIHDFWMARTEVTRAQWERLMGRAELHPEKPNPFRDGDLHTDSLANYRADLPSPYSLPGKAVGHPSQVGSYPPNPWGLYDMHGNAWEWVSDWFALNTGSDVNPKGPVDGLEKVIRGGSWFYGAGNARSAARRPHAPGLWGFSIGFRIVAEPAPRKGP